MWCQNVHRKIWPFPVLLRGRGKVTSSDTWHTCTSEQVLFFFILSWCFRSSLQPISYYRCCLDLDVIHEMLLFLSIVGVISSLIQSQLLVSQIFCNMFEPHFLGCCSLNLLVSRLLSPEKLMWHLTGILSEDMGKLLSLHFWICYLTDIHTQHTLQC